MQYTNPMETNFIEEDADMVNERYLENIQDAFEFARAEGNIERCNEILKEIRHNGFGVDANYLQELLK